MQCTPGCSLLIGQAAIKISEFSQAELAYRKAIELELAGLAAWRGLAELFGATGNYAGIVEANEKLVRPVTKLAAQVGGSQGSDITHQLPRS